MFKDVKEVLESTDPKTMRKGKKISKKTRVNMMALFIFNVFFNDMLRLSGRSGVLHRGT